MTINPAAAAIRKRNTLAADNKTMVMLAWSLFLAGWILMPFAPLAALIIAMVVGDQSGDFAARSHYAKLKSTFWFSLLGLIIIMVILAALTLTIGLPSIGMLLVIPLGFAISLFCTYRSIKGISRANDNRAYS